MFDFLRTKNLIDDIDCEWIFAIFSSALIHFDDQEFYQRTQLVLPTDTFFPGRINDPQSMAEAVFTATVKHGGLLHWPFKLQHQPIEKLDGLTRFSESEYLLKRNSNKQLPDLDGITIIPISYHPHQTTQPTDLAASFSHLIAQHLLLQSQIKPIGGTQLFTENAEILAVFMGFGVMLSNSAYAFRGSCARCFNPYAHRQASLSEDKVVFALALFCKLKKIPKKQAMKHLKPYLRRLYKQAMKQIELHPKKWDALLAIEHE